MEFWETLTSDAFIPRGYCGFWHPIYIWIYSISSALIFSAYMAIAALLIYMFWLDYEIPKTLTRGQATIYGLFIGACGIGHLEGVIAFHAPRYHLISLWHAFTAIVSWIAVIAKTRMRRKSHP